MKLEYIIETKEKILIKDYLIQIGLSRRFCRKVKLYGKMFINNNEAKNFFSLQNGDMLTIEIEEAENPEILTIENDIDIVYEDQNIIVVNKKPNLACQPSIKHQEDNLISYLKYYFKNNNINSNVHLVNRLDMATSGLIIIAKNSCTHHLLTSQDIKIKKKYYAVCEGIFDNIEETINLPIERVKEGAIKRWVIDTGKESVTKYKVIKQKNNVSLLDIELLTGRTHQIRVHMAYLNHPLVGDQIYNSNSVIKSERLYLHCYQVEFLDPFTLEKISLINNPNWLNMEDLLNEIKINVKMT